MKLNQMLPLSGFGILVSFHNLKYKYLPIGIILFATYVNSYSQCPQIICPANITVNADPGKCSAVVNYTPPVGTDPCTSGSNTYNYTGSLQTFTVPSGVSSVNIRVWGAQGASNQGGILGGKGGYATGNLAVTPGDVLNIYVGGTNGYNGGGARGTTPCTAALGGNGGGASDVRLNSTAIGARVIVGAGGGGAGGQRLAGCGRGTGGGGGGGYYGGGGGAAWPGVPPGGPVPTGGTQATGGTGGVSTWASLNPGNNGANGGLGFGGKGGNEISSSQFGSATAQPGGVGGGLTGGNGLYNSANNWTGQSGAGGSSYIGGVTGGSTTSGSRSGNGQVIITYTGATVSTTQIAGLGTGATFPVGTTTETYKATNIFGSATCSFTVTVVDNQPPTATCKNFTTYLNAAGNATITPADINNGSSDNCGVATVTLSKTSFNCSNTGANTVTLTVKDVNGNTSTCNATVTVLDTISPTISCKNFTVYLNAAGSATITANDIDGGSTDNCGIATRVASKTSFNCSNVGANNVALTVTDNSGNSKTCSSVVTVVDTISPTVVCQNYTAYLNASGNVTITPTNVDGGSSDACGIASSTLSKSTFNCSNVGANSVTLTITDNNSNSSSCTATVTVMDTISPTAVCKPFTAYLNASGNVTITANDVDGGSTGSCGIKSITVSPSTFSCANIGANNVTLTITDSSSNSSSCTAVVTVVDTVKPTVVCQNFSTYLNASGNASITANDIDGGSTDACGVASVTASQTSFTCTDVGTNSVYLVVTDVNGNKDSCAAMVTIADTVNPVASCQPFTVYLNASGNATITASDIDGGSTDNCNVDTLIASMTSFGCSNIGTNNVTLYVYDQFNNVDSCTAVVTVMDTIKPTVICQNATVALDANGNASITVTDIDGGSADNCTLTSISLSRTAFSCADVGTQTVTLKVTDAGGNSDSCTATVTIVDNIGPAVICPNDQFVDGDVSCQIVLDDYTSLATGSGDNCSSSATTLTQVPAPGTTVTAENGQTTVWIYIEDGNGNKDSCDFIVNVDCMQELFVPEFISPNGDGKNDFFVIQGINAYPGNTLNIYNRWGNMVFSMKDYDNSWGGKSQNSMTVGSGTLPTGAYFYVLDLGNGDKPMTGYIEVQQ